MSTTATLIRPEIIQDETFTDRYQAAFDYYQNRFELTAEIETYCTSHAIDLMDLGFADGGLSKSIPKRHKFFQTYQKLNLITAEGIDSYSNHLVIPEYKGVDIIGLKFISMEELQKPVELISDPLERLSKNSFKIMLRNRVYTVKNLMRSAHSLKAIITLDTGAFLYDDKVDFLCASKRRRLLNNIVEDTGYPIDEIKDDIKQLSKESKNFEIIEDETNKLSNHAEELLNLIGDEAFTTPTIIELTGWHRMTIKRAIDELHEEKLITQLNHSKPVKYQRSEQITKSHEITSQCDELINS